MTHVPDWWQFFLLAVASFRLWRIVADDDILSRPRRWAFGLGDWQDDGDPVPSTYRRGLAEFVTCPWCLGLWISFAFFGFWLLYPEGALVCATVLALSAVAALIRRVLDHPDEDESDEESEPAS